MHADHAWSETRDQSAEGVRMVANVESHVASGLSQPAAAADVAAIVSAAVAVVAATADDIARA